MFVKSYDKVRVLVKIREQKRYPTPSKSKQSYRFEGVNIVKKTPTSN